MHTQNYVFFCRFQSFCCWSNQSMHAVFINTRVCNVVNFTHFQPRGNSASFCSCAPTCRLFSLPPALHPCPPAAVSAPPCAHSGDPAAPSAQPAGLSGPPDSVGASFGPELLPHASCKFGHHVLARPWTMRGCRRDRCLFVRLKV